MQRVEKESLTTRVLKFASYGSILFGVAGIARSYVETGGIEQVGLVPLCTMLAGALVIWILG